MRNTQGFCCNECYEELTDEELSDYPLLWQYSGDMYCDDCRNCPDDCRQTPCLLEQEETA